MTGPPVAGAAAAGLRAARLARGWSQSAAARELVALGQARGVRMAGAASLKTLLSRWENGHALPEAQYRTLLAELYGRTPAELGIAKPVLEAEDGGAAPRLRAALAAAAALDDPAVQLWQEQLDVATRLDDEFGAAGAGEVVRALVEQLDHTLRHTIDPARRAAVAAVLAPAATLAGAQELDRAHPDRAWLRYDQARGAAAEAGPSGAVAVAAAGQAAVLVDVGEPAAAGRLLDAVEATLPPAAMSPVAGMRAIVRAALGDADAVHAVIASTAELPRVDTARPTITVDLDLDRWHGHALATLGDPAAAIPLRRVLAGPPRSVRHRADAHADLALALAADRPDDAAEHARAAQEIADRIGSRRIPARLSSRR